MSKPTSAPSFITNPVQVRLPLSPAPSFFQTCIEKRGSQAAMTSRSIAPQQRKGFCRDSDRFRAIIARNRCPASAPSGWGITLVTVDGGLPSRFPVVVAPAASTCLTTNSLSVLTCARKVSVWWCCWQGRDYPSPTLSRLYGCAALAARVVSRMKVPTHCFRWLFVPHQTSVTARLDAACVLVATG
jgi:hypothetical protein